MTKRKKIFTYKVIGENKFTKERYHLTEIKCAYPEIAPIVYALQQNDATNTFYYEEKGYWKANALTLDNFRE